MIKIIKYFSLTLKFLIFKYDNLIECATEQNNHKMSVTNEEIN